MKIDTHRLEQELKTVKEHVAMSQDEEIRKRADIERMFIAAREAIDKERQDKYLLLVEQNKLKHKVEKITESLKSYQVCIRIFMLLFTWTRQRRSQKALALLCHKDFICSLVLNQQTWWNHTTQYSKTPLEFGHNSSWKSSLTLLCYRYSVVFRTHCSSFRLCFLLLYSPS